jgi:hypothetical protein
VSAAEPSPTSGRTCLRSCPLALSVKHLCRLVHETQCERWPFIRAELLHEQRLERAPARLHLPLDQPGQLVVSAHQALHALGEGAAGGFEVRTQHAAELLVDQRAVAERLAAQSWSGCRAAPETKGAGLATTDTSDRSGVGGDGGAFPALTSMMRSDT